VATQMYHVTLVWHCKTKNTIKLTKKFDKEVCQNIPLDKFQSQGCFLGVHNIQHIEEAEQLTATREQLMMWFTVTISTDILYLPSSSKNVNNNNIFFNQ